MEAKREKIDREGMRLAALYSLGLHSDDKDLLFDRFVHLAADVFHVPMATISLIDIDRQIYVAKAGLILTETSRAEAICSYTVAQDRTVLIPDASADPLWQSNRYVAGAPRIRFYAGVPLRFSGQPIGTFCLLDSRPCHTFDLGDQKLLESFAFIVSDLLEMNRLRSKSPALDGETSPQRVPSAA